MARFTSIGMPRKTFVSSTAEESRHSPPPSAEAGPSSAGGEGGEDDKPKKKVHRSGKKLKAKRERAAAAAVEAAENGEPLPVANQQVQQVQDRQLVRESQEMGTAWSKEGHAQKRKSGWGRDDDIAKKTRIAERKAEERRVQRIEEKKAALTCFGCRQSGHTARDCPQKGGVTGNICYRCNSTNHSLSNCPRPADPSDPTPYATCFVCGSKGHLSSQCEQNDKGVYVNGGKCNVCGSVRHLIKDCPTLKARREAEAAKAREGDGNEYNGARVGEAGADEDDFMIQARARMRDGERGGKGKREKKAFNNNGLREPYKKSLDLEGAVGEREGVAAASTAAPVAARPKVKAKVVAF